MIRLMLPAEVEMRWVPMAELLAPAIEHDEQRQEADVYRDLMTGDFVAYEIDLPGAQGVAVIDVNQTSVNDKTLWMIYVAGRISGSRTAWVNKVRDMMSYFEALATRLGCSDMRLEGRDWSRVFPEWERVGARNELRKAL